MNAATAAIRVLSQPGAPKINELAHHWFADPHRMTPDQFINKWRDSTLKERSGSQSHFNDLCALLGQPTPTDADPDGTWYTFERSAKKTGGGDGWADVWKRGCFAWEYKGKHKDLIAAFAQLQRYAIALENPPLLIVSDMDTIVVHTNFTNTIQQIHVIPLDDLQQPDTLRLLKQVFTEPERLKPGITTRAITEKAAREFAELAEVLRGRSHDPQQVAHFLNKLLFCMFAEDSDLLPNKLFTKLLKPPSNARRILSAWRRISFARCKTAGASASKRSNGLTAVCSTAKMHCH